MLFLETQKKVPTADWVASIGAGHRRRSGHPRQAGHRRKGIVRAGTLCRTKIGDSHRGGYQPTWFTGGGRGQLLEEALLKAERGAVVV